jgi:hypothetical protein
VCFKYGSETRIGQITDIWTDLLESFYALKSQASEMVETLRLLYFAVWDREDWVKNTEVSEEPATSIIRLNN